MRMSYMPSIEGLKKKDRFLSKRKFYLQTQVATSFLPCVSSLLACVAELRLDGSHIRLVKLLKIKMVGR